MKFLIISSILFTLVLGESSIVTFLKMLKNYHNEYILKYVGTYEFAQHDRLHQKLLIAINKDAAAKACHVIKLDMTLRMYVKDPEVVTKMANEIIQLIKDGQANTTSLTPDQLNGLYKDDVLNRECKDHKLFTMHYAPSFPFPTYAPGVAKPSWDHLDLLEGKDIDDLISKH